MKALTVCQPYAELIARGEKPIENRTWFTDYRGPLAIHAGLSRDWMENDDERRFPGMAFGAVIATADLVACLRVGRPWPLRWAQLETNEHANGPWCWVIENVRRLHAPRPCKGARGLWEWCE